MDQVVINMGKDLVDIAKAKGMHAVFVAGTDSALEMKAAGPHSFIMQTMVALIISIAKRIYVDDYGYDMQEAVAMTIKDLEDRAKLEAG